MNVPLNPATLRAALHGRTRTGWRRRMFLLTVVLPSPLVLLYLSLIAVPRYSVQFRYSVFSQADSSGLINPGLDITQGHASQHSDFVVTDYVTSGQAVSDLSAKLRLAQMFNPPGLDFIFKYWWDNGSIERLTQYWRNYVVSSSYDNYTGVGVVEVNAFSPQDALKLSQTLFSLSEQVLNDLDQRARDAAVTAVQDEVTRSEVRMARSLKALEAFRQTQQTYSPSRPADSAEALASTLRQNLASMNAQYMSLIRNLSPTAPAIVNLKSQMDATAQEIDRVMQLLGNSGALANASRPGQPANPSSASPAARLPNQLSSYENLEAERGFAETAYDTAQKHLEQVTYNDKVQHLYLYAHVRPTLPRQAAYPRALMWTLMSFITLSVCWMIGTLLFFAMRDHTR
jgi:capsular polysaccharide transport system permease protein